MNFPKLATILALLILAPKSELLAQSVPSALPTDPTALMSLAHDKNGLTGSDVKPWHIRGSYHSYDSAGKLEYEGTLEEWWVSPSRYKLSFSNPQFKQIDYATGASLLRDGAQQWLSGPELLLHASLLEPLPPASQLKDFTLQQHTQAAGQSTLNCVSLTYPIDPRVTIQGSFPIACFEPTIPVLRIFSSVAANRVIYDRIISFQGRYLARQIQVFDNNKLSADLNLDVIELLKESPDLALAAPASASSVDLTIVKFQDASHHSWPIPLKKAPPIYPEEAKREKVGGSVTVECTVGIDGHVEHAEIIGSPFMFRSAAMESARQWIFRPFEVMGQARPVLVNIHTVFMSKPPAQPSH